MGKLRKRILASLMSLIIVLNLLPGTAYAALEDLIGNDPSVNQAILDELTSLTGMDEQTVTALLEGYGLLDESGQLKVHETLVLDGQTYTLAEAMDLLEDPNTDLDAYGTVDGTSIRLRDLKTAIQIEQALLNLRDTYFSGRTFSGEALDNLNAFLNQASTQGVLLLAEGEEVPYQTVRTLSLSGFDRVDGHYGGTNATMSGSYISLSAGETISMSVTYEPGMLVNNGQSSPQKVEVGFSTSNWVGNPTFEATPVTFEGDDLVNGATKTLTYTGDGSTSVRMLINVTPTDTDHVTPYAYGDLYGAVHLTDPQGFIFKNESESYVDSHTILIRKPTNEQYQASSTSWLPVSFAETSKTKEETFTRTNAWSSLAFYFLPETNSDTEGNFTNSANYPKVNELNKLIEILQGAKGKPIDETNAVYYTISGTISQTNTYNGGAPLYWTIQEATVNNVFKPAAERHVVNPQETLTLTSGQPVDFSFTAWGKGTNAIPYYYEADHAQGTAVNATSTISNCTIELVDDQTAPLLQSYTAPKGTYTVGQRIPVTLTFDELVVVDETATVTVNGNPYSPADLSMNTAGSTIMLWYPVQAPDNTSLTISLNGVIADIWGNEPKTSDGNDLSGLSIADVTIDSIRLYQAAKGITATSSNGQLTTTVELSDDYRYEQYFTNYHTPTADEAKMVPYRVLLYKSNYNSATQTVTYSYLSTQQVYVDPDTMTYYTDPYDIPRSEQSYMIAAVLQANEGTLAEPNWVNAYLSSNASIAAYVPAGWVMTWVDGGATEVSLSDLEEVRLATLNATVYDKEGTKNATYQSGKWYSNNESIATVVTNDDYSGTVVPTGLAVGQVNFYFLADNGTPDDPSDDVESPSTTFYTITAGDSLALSIPGSVSTIVTRPDETATVLWSSNAKYFLKDDNDAPLPFLYTIKVFEGNYSTGSVLPDTPVYETTATQDENSITIPAGILSQLSSSGIPAYTVQVSMPHPNVSGESRPSLSALAWIVVDPYPAVASLTRPNSIYRTDTAGAVDISWTVENYNNNSVNLTITRVTSDNTATEVYNQAVEATGSYTLKPSPVADGSLKDTYQVVLTVDNGTTEAPSTDSFPLYVYNADAMYLVGGDDQPFGENGLVLDNTGKVSGLTANSEEFAAKTTKEILSMRQELGLLDYIGVNYQDYSWNTFRDGIAWALSNDEQGISINYKQGGLYEDIKNFSFDTYLPEVKMGVAAVQNGQVTITATHASGMEASIPVTATTLRDKFYLFQVNPAVETTLRYQNGAGDLVEVQTNEDGVLALYEPSGIVSDVWLSSQSDGQPFLGTIYQEDLQSGERDATKLQLYPLNTFQLREVAKVELVLTQPGGEPLANTGVTVYGGVYKNSFYCETAELSTRPDRSDGALHGGQTYTTDSDGKLVVYLDATQFWSAENGETADTMLQPSDQIQYVLEISNIANNTYYPLLQTVDGSVGVQERMQTAEDVIFLEEVVSGEANKPFVAQQLIDYHLPNGRMMDVRRSTGLVGPNSTYQDAVLHTTMYLWGEGMDGISDYHLQMVDEQGVVPQAQTSGVVQYPFSTIPIVTNDLTLTQASMTDSGWIEAGADMGLKTRLTQGDTLLQERVMPFRAIDLTQVTPVNEDDNVTGVLLTMGTSSGWSSQANLNIGGVSDRIINTLTGDLKDLTGPVDTSIFKMLISPTEDPSVFHALVWTGYDTLGLDDIETGSSGVSVTANLLSDELEVGVPGVDDLSEMAMGTYDPSSTARQNYRKGYNAGTELNLQLEGYYEAEIRYNATTRQWEVFTKGGGFTAGVGVGFTYNVNTAVGPVPVTASFGLGGAVQLSMQSAARYSQQTDRDGSLLTWSDPEAAGVNDFLTNLRLNAYVNAFGGVGFDVSLVALKFGVFGELGVDSNNSFLSRTYLADSSKRQINGQALTLSSQVGIKFVAKFLFISYENVLASVEVKDQNTFGKWDDIYGYWENAGTGLDGQSLLSVAAQNGLEVVSATRTLQSRDYLSDGLRVWNPSQSRSALDSNSLDQGGDLSVILPNANPVSYPERSDDGTVMAFISDDSSENIYDSHAKYSTLTGTTYETPVAFPDPIEDGDASFTGFGDSDVDIAGTGSTMAAAWVRMGTDIPEKNAGSEITLAEQNLLMNGTEIVVSVYDGSAWESTRLTTNSTPDLAPVVAVNSDGQAVVFWRSVYSASPDNSGLMDFSARDCILYSVYDGSSWDEPQMLYNGSNGSVMALQAAMLPDGTAMAVYTLDRSSVVSFDEANGESGYEVGYTVVESDGTRGSSMLVTSDTWLDENPQVTVADFGSDGYRFVLGWHSLRGGLSDIQMLAVDGSGNMSNTFPASLSAITTSGEAIVGTDFRFAANCDGSGTPGSVDGLTILWSEAVSNDTGSESTDNQFLIAAHSELKAAKLMENGSSCLLTAPLEVAVLPDNTLMDSFSAYVRSDGQVDAVIQATQYDNNSLQDAGRGVMLPSEETILYTATSAFAEQAIELEGIFVDYANLMADSLTPIRFTIRNTGTTPVTDLTITLNQGETAALGTTTLLPNESTTLTVDHQIGATVENVGYTITGSGSAIQQTGTVYLDYPDVGISKMEVLKEEEGRRTIAMTLYNASDAPLAGSGRTVKLAFYTDNILTETAGVTCTTGGVRVESDGTLTISGDTALQRMDDGAFTLELTYDVKGYVEGTLQEKEIPASGVYLFADLFVEGKIGAQSTSQRLPEYSSANNQAAVLLTGAYARTGEAVSLNLEQGTENDKTVAYVKLRNNSLQNYTGGKLAASLLDADGNVLQTKITNIPTSLVGEKDYTEKVSFDYAGSRVVVCAAPSNTDILSFDGLPVSLSDFTQAEGDTYTYALSGVSVDSTVVTAVSGSGAAVNINGTDFADGAGSLQVPINSWETSITVKIGSKTYVLTLNSGNAPSSGGGGSASYQIAVEPSENGSVTANRAAATSNTIIKLTVTPDAGYRLSGLTVTTSNGRSVTLTNQGDGTYTFAMPASKVTVKAIFAPIDQGGLPFIDVPLGAWYYNPVYYVYENGLMAGTSDTTFSPNVVTTRAMIATILWRLEGSPSVNYAMSYEDVEPSAWYGEAIRWASAQGIAAGYGDGTFGPNDPITREQFVAMLYRYAQHNEYDVSIGEDTDIRSYADFAQLSEYAIPAMQWSCGAGLVTGTSATTLSPLSGATRAEAATILMQFCKMMEEDR